MLYVQQSLAPEEDLIYVAKFHWFYDLQAVMCMVWGLILALGIIISFQVLVNALPPNFAVHVMTAAPEHGDSWLNTVRKLHPGIKLFALFVFLMGVFKFAQMLVIKATTEIVVTSTRLIYKRGLVARNVGEMNIDRIESVSVIQSFWGRIFDFGRLIIHGMGVGSINMPNLAEPLKFRRAIEQARTD